MSLQSKLDRMEYLVNILSIAGKEYYGNDNEIMTNYEYDKLSDELKTLEEETGIVHPNSPLHKVGDDEDEIKGEKEPHEFPAVSLDKTKFIEKLVKWSNAMFIYMSWKLDGLTLVATYDNGKLSKLLTRGNGIIGTNITHKAGAIKGIPQKINYKGHLVIRGEALITYSDFNRFMLEKGGKYKNPRNLAAGSLNLDDLEELKSRNVQWIPFTLVHIDDGINDYEERLKFLTSQGFNVVEYIPIPNPDEASIAAAIEIFNEKLKSGKFDIPVDGLVICYKNFAYSQSGKIVSGHHSTTAGYAFKWKDTEAKTKLKRIEWSCATNSITPVAIFEPVELEGTTVQRASLCNISECKRLGIGEGSNLTIIKANKIIPKCVAATKGILNIPDTCPVCGHPTAIDSSDSGTEILVCTNVNCTAKNLSKLTRFVSKDGMDIDGMSRQTISMLINKGWVTDFASIYDLDKFKSEWAMEEGYGEKSVTKNLKSIQKSKTTDFVHFMCALSIPGIGKEMVKLLKSHLDSIYDKYAKKYEIESTYDLIWLLRCLVENEDYDFRNIDTIGDVTNTALKEWVTENLIKDASLNRLIKMLTFTDVKPITTANNKPLAGKTFVITGTLESFKNRDELVTTIESLGGKTSGSVSKNTSYLINNDTTSDSSKNKKAKELGIRIISENEFIDMIKN